MTKDIFADMANQMAPSAELVSALKMQIDNMPPSPQVPTALDVPQVAPRASFSKRFVAAIAATMCATVFALSTLLNGAGSINGVPPFVPVRFIPQVADDYSDLYRAMATLLNNTVYYETSLEGGLALPEAGSAPTGGSVTSTDATVVGTNNQVQGIDEADIIKTNGNEIYVLTDTEVVVLLADGANTGQLARFSWPGVDTANASGNSTRASDLLLHNDTLAIITSRCEYYDNGNDNNDLWVWQPQYCFTEALLYDVGDPTIPTLRTTVGQSGYFNTARLQNGVLYLVSNYYVEATQEGIAADDPKTFVPQVTTDGNATVMEPGDIALCPSPSGPQFAVITSIDMASGMRIDQESVLGASDTVYMSYDNLYLAGAAHFATPVVLDVGGTDPVPTAMDTLVPTAPGVPTPTPADTSASSTALEPTATTPVGSEVPEAPSPVQADAPTTNLVRISLADGVLDVVANGSIPGWVMGQFALDEYEGNLRVAVTIQGDNWMSDSALYVLNPDLQVVGGIAPLMVGESVQSVRFMGEVGYIVTFVQTDPLFAIDLSDPANPSVMSELHLPGFSSYLHPWGADQLIGFGFQGDEFGLTEGLKLSIFETRDPFAVIESQELLIDHAYSEATSDHHAVLADEASKLVAFPATRYRGPGSNDYYGVTEYMVYRDTDAGAFELVATIELSQDAYLVRGILIDSTMYVYDGRLISVL